MCVLAGFRGMCGSGDPLGASTKCPQPFEIPSRVSHSQRCDQDFSLRITDLEGALIVGGADSTHARVLRRTTPL